MFTKEPTFTPGEQLADTWRQQLVTFKSYGEPFGDGTLTPCTIIGADGLERATYTNQLRPLTAAEREAIGKDQGNV